ncbi:MAG: amidohydrolase family protein [Gemmatimonadota bacterium]
MGFRREGATIVAVVCSILVLPLAAQAPIAITHVTVLDMTGALARADQTVIVRGNRIEAVGKASAIKAPSGATLVDGRGKYLIPGLWDMHVHLTVPGGETLLSVYVANGVTGVRDMNDSFPAVVNWRRRIADGSLIGPRIVASGPYLEGGWVPIPHIVVKTPEQGRAGVDSLAKLGVDFVKIHNRLSRATYFAIAEEVKKRGWVFAGHLPDSVTFVEAADAGQRSLEHLFGIPSVCAPEEVAALKPAHPIQSFLGACAESDPTPGFRHLAQVGTWVVPTLVVNYPVAILPDSVLGSDSILKYKSAALAKLERLMMTMPKNVPPAAGAVGRRIFAKRVELIGVLHRNGVRLMTGTDAPGKNAFPGFSLHDELAYFVQGGMTPMDALRSATYEPARYLSALDSLGTVEPGKVADLVLLDADPEADIKNTRRIAAVFTRGRLIGREARAALLERAEAAAKAP